MTNPLSALRAALTAEKLDGFIIPMADEFQNEYVPPSSRRVEYLTGFTGSAGQALVLQDRAAFFTDSRYTLQAKTEVPDTFTLFDTADKLPADWIADTMQAGQRLGYDPWLHAVQSVERLQKAAAKRNITLVAVTHNPIDAIWTDRPAPPIAAITPHALEFAGQDSITKRQAIAEKLRAQPCAAVILTDPASTAWLLNIRGGDVPHTPLPLSFSILHDDATVDWFVDPRKVTPELATHLGSDVRIHHANAFTDALAKLGTQKKSIAVDPALCAAAIAQQLTNAGAQLVPGDDPCALPRACKNLVEQQGTRAAHRRDGAALAQFFSWLAQQPPGTVGELQAEQMLETCRATQNMYRGSSFATIAGSGAHGAIVHYRATATTDRTLQAGELFLLDSGGQYLDGTTDVTRTVAIGTPSDTMRDHYTRVVKGHIALAAVKFPPGTTGAELDVLARQFLWAAGLDYGHGTGHGVGSYLGVHEGPQSISRRAKGSVALQPGMILSNEPGYYKTSAYGIRFENLMLVTEAQIPEGGEQAMLGFEILTLAPLDRTLLQRDLLTQPEIDWINAYHARVRAEITAQVQGATQTWVLQMTETL